jgi:hypothetical protein
VLLVILYAVVMVYASTIVGVVGPHFVPIDLSEALRRLIHMPYVEHGSDQRSDWMGNLLMLVPLGFLVAGWLSPGPMSSWANPAPSHVPRRPRGRPWSMETSWPGLTGLPASPDSLSHRCERAGGPVDPPTRWGEGHDVLCGGVPDPAAVLAERSAAARTDRDGWLEADHDELRGGVPDPASIPTALAAFALCLAFIVLVKFGQLFFPPRTVTLNYVIAQGIGAGIGILLFLVLRRPLADSRHDRGRLEDLRLTLRIYTGLVIVFMLLPLDFALNADEVAAQLARLPGTVFGPNGEDRPLLVRIAVGVAGMLAVAPIGAMLALVGRGRIYVGRSTSAVAWIGCFAMLGVYALTTLVISGTASLPAVVSRTIGIALGSWFMHWLARQNSEEVRQDLADLVPRAVPIYLLTLFGVNGLLSLDWNTVQGAVGELSRLGLLPGYNYYIVSKAQAAKNIVGHMAMYAPIGIMVWLRLARGGGTITALLLGGVLSAIVETGRFLRPGLAPDINAIPLAAVSAWAAAALMPAFWRMLSAVPPGRSVTPPLRLALGEPAPAWWDRDTNRRARRRDRNKVQDTTNGADIEHY